MTSPDPSGEVAGALRDTAEPLRDIAHGLRDAENTLRDTIFTPDYAEKRPRDPDFG